MLLAAKGHRGGGSGAAPGSHRLPLLRLPLIPHLLRQYEELAGTSAERQPLVHRPGRLLVPMRPGSVRILLEDRWPASSSRASLNIGAS